MESPVLLEHIDSLRSAFRHSNLPFRRNGFFQLPERRRSEQFACPRRSYNRELNVSVNRKVIKGARGIWTLLTASSASFPNLFLFFSILLLRPWQFLSPSGFLNIFGLSLDVSVLFHAFLGRIEDSCNWNISIMPPSFVYKYGTKQVERLFSPPSWKERKRAFV